MVAWSVVETGGGDALAASPPSGLSHLDSALKGTGRIADTPVKVGGIDKAATGDSREVEVRPVSRDGDMESPKMPEKVSAALEVQYRKAEPYLEGCRIEVAK